MLETAGSLPLRAPTPLATTGTPLFRSAKPSYIYAMQALIFDHGVNEWNHLPRGPITAHLEAIRHDATLGTVALAAGELVGFCTFTLGKPFAKYERGRACRDHAHIHEVVVHRDFNGHGIGTQLLEQCKRQARTRGMRAVYIDRHADNTASAAIMRKAGFVEIDTYPDPERRPTGTGMSTVCRFVFAGA